MRMSWAIFFVAAGIMMSARLPLRAADSPTLASPPRDAQSEALISRLKELWETRRSEIQTADVHYRMFHGVKLDPPLTMEQLEQRIDEFELRTAPRRALEFLGAVSASKFKSDVATRRLCIDGPKARYECGDTIKVHDADYLFHQDLFNKTIQVNWTGASITPIPPLTWLRDIPPDLVLQPENLTITETTSNIDLAYDTSIEIQGQTQPLRREFQFDKISGIPLRRHYITNSKPTETLYQLALVTGPDGVVFPGCVIRLKYQTEGPGDLVREIDLTELVDSRFNHSISPDTFVMPKPRGFVLLDHRAGEKRLGSINEDVNNAKSLVNPVVTIDFGPAPVSWQRRAFFMVNGLLFIALGIWLWRRVSLKEPNH